MILMLKLKKVDISDAEFIGDLMRRCPSEQFINCFESFFLWSEVYSIEYAQYRDLLIFKMTYNGQTSFFYPLGTGDVLSLFRELSKQFGTLRINKLNPDQILKISGFLPSENYTSISLPENYEYIFDTDKFRYYRGDSMKAKRNFVNFFKKNFEWSYEPISEKNIEYNRKFAEQFSGDDTFDDDNAALFVAIDNYTKLSLDGAVIRVEGDVRAMFICAPLGEEGSGAGLFLRADHQFKGIIPLLYQEFFLHNPAYKRINLGEDLGLEGLRKNKESYNPDSLLELTNIELYVGSI